MGSIFCLFADTTQLAAVARNVCPFPDYGPSPLLNSMRLANSSLRLSEHYAAVQASLTPQQQQDFTQTLRTTFGPEGKVSYGALPIVALSLTIFFDAVASRVKGQYVSDQEPIPGLFLKDPTGTYPAPVYTISKYLRLVPHIANNPTRMRHETEKYLLELQQTGDLAMDKIIAAKEYEDLTVINLNQCFFIGQNMASHLWLISNKTKNVRLKNFMERKNSNGDFKPHFSLNCDPEEASQRFRSIVDSLDDGSKEFYKDCIKQDRDNKTDIEIIAEFNMVYNTVAIMPPPSSEFDETEDFDLKSNALGKWT